MLFKKKISFENYQKIFQRMSFTFKNDSFLNQLKDISMKSKSIQNHKIFFKFIDYNQKNFIFKTKKYFSGKILNEIETNTIYKTNINQKEEKNDLFNQDVPAEEERLRKIQMNPKYEVALSLFLSGEYSKGIEYLYQLKDDKKNENDFLNDDFVFLIKKIVFYNKANGKAVHNTFILKELAEVVHFLYQNDINQLFDNIEYIIINLIQSDNKEALLYIEDVIKKELTPSFFNHIFNYYLGSSYALEGKIDYLKKSIDILEGNLNELDDKFLRGCHLNNIACVRWWLNIPEILHNLSNAKISDGNYELLNKLAAESVQIIKIFKKAVNEIEGLECNLDTNFDYIKESEALKNEIEELNKKAVDFKEGNTNLEINQKGEKSPNEKILDLKFTNIMKYILSRSFDTDKSFESVFLTDITMKDTKFSFIRNKSAAIILSNLAEFYNCMRDYKRSQIILNIASIYFELYDKDDVLFYKNYSFIIINNFQITRSVDSSKIMFEKLYSHVKNLSNSYEKVVILRNYVEFLLENDRNSILASSLLEEADNIEKSLKIIEFKRGYLIIPTE